LKKFELVIFDMDGLLFDTERPSFKAMRQVMEKQGYEFPMETYKLLVGISDRESDVILKEIYGQDFSIQQILKEYKLTFREMINQEGILIKQGTKELLDAIDQKGIKKCIASSSSRQTIEYYLALADLTDRFDFYVSGEEVERGKPNPDIFQEACRRAQETSETSLVLEDSLNGLRAAVGAGMKCIIVPDLIEPNAEMEKNAFKIVSDLEQVIQHL